MYERNEFNMFNKCVFDDLEKNEIEQMECRLVNDSKEYERLKSELKAKIENYKTKNPETNGKNYYLTLAESAKNRMEFKKDRTLSNLALAVFICSIILTSLATAFLNLAIQNDCSKCCCCEPIHNLIVFGLAGIALIFLVCRTQKLLCEKYKKIAFYNAVCRILEDIQQK